MTEPEPQPAADPWADPDYSPDLAPALPMATIHSIVDCAYQLPPGTAAERWAALMEPRREADPGPEPELEP